MSVSKKKVLFIGAINEGNSPIGGEDYKNQLFVAKLDSKFNLAFVDTFHWNRRPAVIVRLLWYLIFRKFDKIIISASSASTYRLLIFLSFFPNILIKTYYFVIGGYFPEGLKKGQYDIKYYRRLKGIILEGEMLKHQIESIENLNNLFVVPNFKVFKQIAKSNNQIINEDYIFKFVFISRISKSKGIDTIFKAMHLLNSKGLQNKFSIDFYGRIDADFIGEFDLGLYSNSNCYYKGYLDLMNNGDEGYKKLSDYDIMLFPTYWKGEGFPGVIIDAFVAGLTVVASDWNMNCEILENERTGLIFPTRDYRGLADAMHRLIANPFYLHELSNNSKQKSQEYHLDRVWPKIEKVILNCE